MTDSKPSLGVMFRREQNPSTLMAAARKAEQLGFDEFWLVEDCFYMGGISQTAMALAATSTIKVGIGINPGVAHNAAILAMEYSTLARAFPGRFLGGIGHGVSVWMEQIGEKVASPLTAIEETTTAVRNLLRGECLTVPGRYVQLNDVVLDPPPDIVPPVYLGVVGEKSMALAGRCADGVLLAENASPVYVRWARSVMDAQRTDRGFVGVYVNTLVDEKNPRAALQTMRRVVADAIGNEISAFTKPVGYSDELRELIDGGGSENVYAAMPDAWVHDFSIAGSVEDAWGSISRLHEAGADSVILCPLPAWDYFAWLDQVGGLIG